MPVKTNKSNKMKPIVIEEIKKSAIKDLLAITIIFFALLVVLVTFYIESNHHLFLGIKYNGLLEVNELLVVAMIFMLCAFIYIWRRFRDMKAIQKEILQKAYFDTTTTLPNRDFVLERLEKQMLLARKNEHFAIAFIDFDRFKIINDTYGHDVGDELLRLAGKRLSRVMEGREVVARLGGDEFLFVSTLDAPLDIESVITRLRSTRSAPFRINHLHIDIDYSIGVAIYPDDGQTISELMRAADSAMYYAKLHGDDYCVYTHSADMKNLPLH